MTRVAIVTGASRGIGAEIARGLAARGLAVVVNHRASPAEADAVVAAIRAGGGTAEACAADVADEAGVADLFRAAAGLGRLSVLVNNAAWFGRVGRRVDETDRATVERTLQVNVLGPFLTCGAAVRAMSTRHGGEGGRIVNISSTAAERGSPNDWVDYAASKGALNVLTRGLALEVIREGVRVNAVAAGLTDTDSHARAGDAERVDRLSERVPMGRAATAAEIAGTVVWLALDAPDYMTGAILPVAGGF